MKTNVFMLVSFVTVALSCKKDKSHIIPEKINADLMLTRSAQLEIVAKYEAFYNGTTLPDFAKLERDAFLLTQYIYVQARTAGQSYFLLVPKAQETQRGRYVFIDPVSTYAQFSKLVIQSKYIIYYSK